MMDGSERHKRTKCCSLFLVKVLWACPLPHWCYVKWLNTHKNPAINHVTPMQGSGLGPKDYLLTHYAKWEESQRLMLRRVCFTRGLGNIVWGLHSKKKGKKMSHICIFCYDRVVLHGHLGLGGWKQTSNTGDEISCFFVEKHWGNVDLSAIVMATQLEHKWNWMLSTFVWTTPRFVELTTHLFHVLMGNMTVSCLLFARHRCHIGGIRGTCPWAGNVRKFPMCV